MRRGVSLLGLLLVVSVVGWGYTIDLLVLGKPYSLYNTGVDDNGVPLTGKVVDKHYEDTYLGSFPYAYRNSNWMPDLTYARWIGPGPFSNPSSVPSSDYPVVSFRTHFTLPTDMPFWNVELSVYAWADDYVKEISLRDDLLQVLTWVTPNMGSSPCGYTIGPPCTFSGGPTQLTYNGLLGGGTYYIQFDVVNGNNVTPNTAGLLVQWDRGIAIGTPEPATYALMGTVGLALYLLRRRRAGAKN